MMPSDPLAPPSPGPVPMEELRAVAVRAAKRARRWQAHALADLDWLDRERPPDAVRASCLRLLDGAVTMIATRLSEALPVPDDAVARCGELLRQAGWPDGDTRAVALAQARREWLSGRLFVATRALGASDPLAEIGASDAPVAALALDLAAAARTGGPLRLDARTAHDLAWSVAAALRVVVGQARAMHPHDDAALRDTVAAVLIEHDEGSAAGPLARRIVRSLPSDHPMASDALLSGHVALFAALVADRADASADEIEDWLFAPDPLPLAVAMRAAGEPAAVAGGALAAAAQALDRPIGPVLGAAETLHRLAVEDARALLPELSR